MFPVPFVTSQWSVATGKGLALVYDRLLAPICGPGISPVLAAGRFQSKHAPEHRFTPPSVNKLIKSVELYTFAILLAESINSKLLKLDRETQNIFIIYIKIV